MTAVRAIRQAASGPRLVRAIGFYALLCQLANEQRHSGEHRVVRVSYETLTQRGQVSKSTVKALLDTLARARRGPVRARQRPRARRGREPPAPAVHEGAWTAVTVAMAEHLAQRAAGRAPVA